MHKEEHERIKQERNKMKILRGESLFHDDDQRKFLDFLLKDRYLCKFFNRMIHGCSHFKSASEYLSRNACAVNKNTDKFKDDLYRRLKGKKLDEKFKSNCLKDEEGDELAAEILSDLEQVKKIKSKFRNFCKCNCTSDNFNRGVGGDYIRMCMVKALWEKMAEPTDNNKPEQLEQLDKIKQLLRMNSKDGDLIITFMKAYFK